MPSESDEKRGKLKFSVYIVESPSGDDLYHKRFEGEILSKALALADIPSEHRLAVDLAAFNAALTHQLQSYLSSSQGRLPVLHISAHGSEDGIVLTDGTKIDWIQLREKIMPLNEALGGYLILCMSSCKGFQACRMAMQAGESPFYGVIGHSGKPSWIDTAVAFMTFYHLLAKGRKVPDIVKAMRIASGDSDFKQILSTEARRVFVEAIKGIRIKALAKRLRRVSPRPPGSSLTKKSKMKK